ncbi:MAG: alpha/beta fold hydrolase [Alphaproteobacteria bacterium]|jgi:polyhydroxyalkanoate synthase|nr:alpha/beta fold hydrolase [Alphaproteobacteria bacterium]MDP6517356.1 alpha/beta fold hydrolase [Alphaproteobacteria bacterium]
MTTARTEPTPPPRPGPRPLALHLTLASGTWLGALGALPLALNGAIPWRPELAARAKTLTESLATSDAARAADALAVEIGDRHADLVAGIRGYRAHPYRRRVAEPPVVWRQGTTRLLDYGAVNRAADGASVLFVPSLVNRAYILDLAPRRSLMRYLSRRGIRPFLLDWGDPGGEERGFDLTKYMVARLRPALEAACAHGGGSVGLVGYCMGGLLALALALQCPRSVTSLALLATPWDFHADNPAAPILGAAGAALPAAGVMPVDLLQSFFALADPLAVAAKFRAFAALAPDSTRARAFVQIEDWLNDGVPLAAPAARECLIGWYGENRPARGTWRVAGRPVRPAALTVPALVVIPARDRIVPMASAEALAGAIGNPETLRPAAGHIGMVVGRRARAGLWRPLAAWLCDHGKRHRPGT